MTVDPQKAKGIFLDAVERHAPAEWADYLQQACGDDAELRHWVEELLAAHRGEDSLLDRAVLDRAATGRHITMPRTEGLPISECPGTRIGPYKLLEKIGEGGMGVVYLAEQKEPVARRVALKIIKPGMDTQQVIARFEAERQALALMDHPNIAKVFDAGTTDSGRPYFVMELVSGIPVTQFCCLGRAGLNRRHDGQRLAGDRGESRTTIGRQLADKRWRSEQQARRDADANFQLARKAVEESINKVAAEPRLKQSDFHDLRRDLLGSAVPFYEEFVKQQADNPELRWQLGQAHFQLAFVRAEMGEPQVAQTHYELARDIHQRIVDENPGVAAYQAGLAQCHNNLGLLLLSQGRAEPAAAELLAAWKLYGTLSATSPKSAYLRVAMVGSQYNYGLALRDAGQFAQAELEFRAAAQTQQAVVETAPDEPGCRRLAALIHNDLGRLFAMQRKYAEAESELLIALGLREELVRLTDNSPQARYDLAATLYERSVVLRELDRMDESEEAARASLDIATTLANEFPRVDGYVKGLAQNRSRLASVLQARNKLEEAETEYRR